MYLGANALIVISVFPREKTLCLGWRNLIRSDSVIDIRIMASRMDEVTRYGESIDLDEIEDEIERKKIYKQRKEKKRVENLGIAYEKLAAKMASHSVHGGNERARDGRNGRRRSPSRLSVLASALAHIKNLRQQIHMVASTPDSSDGKSTFRISQILPTAVDRCSSSSSRRQGSSSTESSQCQSSSESSSETTPTGLMPVYGSSDVLPSHIEQVSLNYFNLSC